jgi:hypothetical protein
MCTVRAFGPQRRPPRSAVRPRSSQATFAWFAPNRHTERSRTRGLPVHRGCDAELLPRSRRADRRDRLRRDRLLNHRRVRVGFFVLRQRIPHLCAALQQREVVRIRGRERMPGPAEVSAWVWLVKLVFLTYAKPFRVRRLTPSMTSVLVASIHSSNHCRRPNRVPAVVCGWYLVPINQISDGESSAKAASSSTGGASSGSDGGLTSPGAGADAGSGGSGPYSACLSGSHAECSPNIAESDQSARSTATSITTVPGPSDGTAVRVA